MGSNWWRWQVGLAVVCALHYIGATDSDLRPTVDARQPSSVLIWEDERGVSVSAIRFSKNGYLASSTSSQLRLRKMATGQDVRLLDNGESCGLSPAFSPDGRVLAIGGRTPEVRLWDTGTGKVREPLRIGTETARTVDFSPDGTTLAVASGRSSRISLWDWTHRRRLANLDGRRGDINILAFSPDGTRLVSVDSTEEVSVWDVASRKAVSSLRAHKAGITTLAFSPSGRLFVTASYAEGVVRFWDPATGQPRGCLPSVLYGLTGVAFSPDATILAVSRSDEASLWNLASARQVGLVRVMTGSLQAIAFAADGRTLATGGSEGALRLWDLSNVIGEGQGGSQAQNLALSKSITARQ